MKKILAIAIVMLVAVTCVFASGNKEKNEYVFAANCTWPPLEFIAEDGSITGYEVELVQEIGKAVGKNFVIKNVAWETIFAGLANGQYDAISSGVTVTEERKLTMDFATPFMNQGQVIVTTVEKADVFTSYESLKGKKVGVQMGTTGDFALDDSGAIVSKYDEIDLAILDLANGNTEAVVCDSLIAADFVLVNPSYQGKLVVSCEPFTEELIAMCVQKGNTELLSWINEGFAILEKNGKLAELKAKYGII